MNTSVKLVLDQRRSRKDHTYPVALRLIHNRQTTHIALGYSILEKDWNPSTAEIKKSCKSVGGVNRANQLVLKKRSDAKTLITDLERDKELSRLPIAELRKMIIGASTGDGSVFRFMQQQIDELRKIGKYGNARVYRDSLKAWKNYRNQKDIEFKQIDYRVLKGFENYFLARKTKPNTISVYLRTFRAVYNKAIKENIVSKEHYPFDRYQIPSNKTRKKAVSLDIISLIEHYQPEPGTRLWNAKNYFLFSFYTRGMNFVDMALLRLRNFADGRINYTRLKTGGKFSIKINPKAQAIIDLYQHGKKKKDYLFPIVQSTEDPARAFLEVKNGLNYFNKALKTISKELELETTLSSYTARHTYATGLKMKGLSVEVIKESLGHTDIKTTETYLKSFENSVVDEADEILFG